MTSRRLALSQGELAKSPDILSLQYGATRDFLIVSVTHAVGTRPGALEAATLGMFRSAQWDDEHQYFSQVIIIFFLK